MKVSKQLDMITGKLAFTFCFICCWYYTTHLSAVWQGNTYRATLLCKNQKRKLYFATFVFFCLKNDIHLHLLVTGIERCASFKNHIQWFIISTLTIRQDPTVNIDFKESKCTVWPTKTATRPLKWASASFTFHRPLQENNDFLSGKIAAIDRFVSEYDFLKMD